MKEVRYPSFKSQISTIQIAERAGVLIKEIVNEIQNTAGFVKEISLSGKEQSEGVNEINLAVAQLDSLTQKNASTSEELASTSEEFLSQAKSLKRMIDFFKI
ncbi:MAG: hypothetical protein H7A24_15685 [Leptospiraceae bacterium]|nr:hypothetical protein [Leptospiraceae bacterium]MCP5513328.1 hypothetical protein [Leptospiraceae bacterium]